MSFLVLVAPLERATIFAVAPFSARGQNDARTRIVKLASGHDEFKCDCPGSVTEYYSCVARNDLKRAFEVELPHNPALGQRGFQFLHTGVGDLGADEI